MILPLLPLILDDVPQGLCRALSQEGVPAIERSTAGNCGRYVLYDSRQRARPELAPGQFAIDVDLLRLGRRHDPMESLLDEQAERRAWEVPPLRVSEEVARVDKRAVRRELMHHLRGLIEAAGGVWLKLAAYPFPYRSAFNFRLDHDEFHAGDFATTLAIIAGHEQAVSHYICASTHEGHGQALQALRGCDVGSHGFWHHTYHEPRQNLKNIRRGIESLRQCGLEPSGYVSPHGRFNRGLQWALEELAVSHSSEFGLAYDELPFFPIGSKVLQIPVHPVCLGIFLEARKSPAFAGWPVERILELSASYFAESIRARYQAGEPVFLYGHPDGRIGRYPHVLQTVLKTAERCSDLWKIDRTSFAAWWRARDRVRLQVDREDAALVASVDALPPGFRLAIEYWRGNHVAVMPIDATVVRFTPEALIFEKRGPPDLPKARRIDPPHGLRGSLRRYLDWEKVTPIAEIETDSWRGWLKRTLRRVRS